MTVKLPQTSFFRRPEWQLAFLLAAILLGVRLVTGFNGHYGQDANEYVRFGQEIRNWLTGGPKPGSFFWPWAYPSLGAILSFGLGDVAFALQLVSILSHVLLIPLTVALIRQLAEVERHDWLAVYVFLFVGCSPFLVRNALLTMTDSLSILLAGMAILHAVRYFQKVDHAQLLFAGIWAGLAGLLRYNNLFVLLVPAAMVGWRVIKSRKWAHLLLPTLTAVAIIAPELLLHEREGHFYSFADLWKDISPLTWFQSSYPTHEGILSYPMPNGVYMFMPIYYPGYFLAAIPLLVISIWKGMWRGRAAMIWVLATAIFFMLFTGMVHMQVNRLLIPVIPLLVAVCFPAFSWLMVKIAHPRWMLWGAIILLVVQGGLTIRALGPTFRRNALEQTLVSAIKGNCTSKVYTFDMETAFAAYAVSCEVESLWYRQIEDAQKGERVLVNLPVLQKQFVGYPPMQNWDRFQNTFSVDTLKLLPEGWVLYELR